MNTEKKLAVLFCLVGAACLVVGLFFIQDAPRLNTLSIVGGAILFAVVYLSVIPPGKGGGGGGGNSGDGGSSGVGEGEMSQNKMRRNRIFMYLCLFAGVLIVGGLVLIPFVPNSALVSVLGFFFFAFSFIWWVPTGGGGDGGSGGGGCGGGGCGGGGG